MLRASTMGAGESGEPPKKQPKKIFNFMLALVSRTPTMARRRQKISQLAKIVETINYGEKPC